MTGPRILALDIATTSGFAHGVPGGKPISGIIKLPDARHRGRRFWMLEGVIRQLIANNHIERVAVESLYITPYRKGNSAAPTFSMDQILLSVGYQAVVRMACEKEGVAEELIEVSPSAWRSKLGVGRAPAWIKAEKRRAWLKAEAKKRCEELGFTPQTDDEADALGVWLFAEQILSQADSNARLPLFSMVRI